MGCFQGAGEDGFEFEVFACLDGGEVLLFDKDTCTTVLASDLSIRRQYGRTSANDGDTGLSAHLVQTFPYEYACALFTT